MIAEGSEAPDFQLETDAGDAVRLSELRGRPVVLFFYPKDETRGCTTQVCGMRDAYPDFEGRAHVFGISGDDAASHASFRANHGLPFPLLVDEDGSVADAYGVDSFETEAYGTLRRRQTVVVDADGRVAVALPDVDPETHAADVLAALPA